LNWSLISVWILRKLRMTEEGDTSLLLLRVLSKGPGMTEILYGRLR
jgi:hypothetical protein